MIIYLQTSASIQPRKSHPNFGTRVFLILTLTGFPMQNPGLRAHRDVDPVRDTFLALSSNFSSLLLRPVDNGDVTSKAQLAC